MTSKGRASSAGGDREFQGPPNLRDALLRLMWDQSPIGRIRYDANGVVVECNPAAVTILGLSGPEAIIGLNIFDDPNLSDEVKSRLQGGETVTTELAYNFDRISSEGFYETSRQGPRHLDVTLSPVFSDEPAHAILGYLSQVRDVTIREEYRARLETLFRLLPVGISVLDAQGNVIVANESMQKILRLSDEDLRHGRHRARHYIHSDGSDMPQSEFPSAQVMGGLPEKRDVELGILCEDGEIVWVQVSAAAVPMSDWKITTTVTDITAQKRAELSLRRALAELDYSRGYFRSLLDAIPNGMLVLDERGMVQFVNAVIRERWGVEEGREVGRCVGEILRCPVALAGKGRCGELPVCAECMVHLTIENARSGAQAFRNRVALETEGPGGVEKVVLQISAIAQQYLGERGVTMLLEDITELSQLRRQAKKEDAFAGMISREPAMLELFDSIRDVAGADVPVLIEGESGTGKELVANAIHALSHRSTAPFVPVSCGSLPETLLESELFGHVKGAFTGAVRDKKGRFELADGGTIFLDEIGELSPSMQVKLLRVLQEGTYERVGGEKTLRTSARVVSATNRNLRAEVAAHRFRQDLFYRLAVVPVTVPPLRQRPRDIPLLADQILGEFARKLGKAAPQVSRPAMDLLVAHSWPGNVRELQNVLHFAVIKGKNPEIMPEDLPLAVRAAAVEQPSRTGRPTGLTREAVMQALTEAGGVRSEAARLLGVSRATFYRFFSQMEG